MIILSDITSTVLGHSVSEYHPLLSYIKENTFQHNFKQLYKLNKSMFRKVVSKYVEKLYVNRKTDINEGSDILF